MIQKFIRNLLLNTPHPKNVPLWVKISREIHAEMYEYLLENHQIPESLPDQIDIY